VVQILVGKSWRREPLIPHGKCGDKVTRDRKVSIDLSLVDPPIRGLIRDLNLLPFVKKTTFSCSATGKRARGGKHLAHDRIGGYFTLIYNKNLEDDARKFHDKLIKIMISIPFGKNLNKRKQNDFHTNNGYYLSINNSFSYNIMQNGNNTYLALKIPNWLATHKGIMDRWRLVHNLVKDFLVAAG